MKSAKLILAFVNAKIGEYTSALAAESNPILKEHLKQILAEYSGIKNFIIPKNVTIDGKKWVNLGLPSGRLWAAENEPGHHQFDEAVKTFGDMLPSAEAWKELFYHCDREWDYKRRGYIFTGPNDNTLFLPADGWIDWNKETEELNNSVYNVGDIGNYWSSTPDGKNYARKADFCSVCVDTNDIDYHLKAYSVRLTREYR